MHAHAYSLYNILLAPKSQTENLRRRELIFNIIIGSSLLFLLFLDTAVLYNSLTNPHYEGVAFPLFNTVVVTFFGIYTLSRLGYFITASYIFIAVYFTVTTYSAYQWGTYMPSTLLNYVLLIIISSILISAGFGFVVTGSAGAVLGIIGFMDIERNLRLANFWNNHKYAMNDVAELVITFFVIMTISWLSNREIEKSLMRARKSEKALEMERDNLEITVEQRTQKLRELETERVAELHRMAESGKQAAGFFHDLMNPLTAIAMSVQDLKNKAPAMADNVKASLDQALTASRRMENFIDAIRRQSQNDEAETVFSLNEEVEQAVLLLQHKTKAAGISISYLANAKIYGRGKPLQFYQIISNLLSNAIESYEPSNRGGKVLLYLQAAEGQVKITVSDQGKGIPLSLQGQIFNHFFTTKPHKGMGLGLAITKNVVEKYFSGTITLESTANGTTFVVLLPIYPNFFVTNG